MLKPGDRLTIHRHATVWLTQYDSLKPSVTLTREVGDDPAADRAEMERVCYVELRRALLDEVRTRRQFKKLMGDEMKLTPLLKHCEEVVSGGYTRAKEGAIEGVAEGQVARREGREASSSRKRR